MQARMSNPTTILAFRHAGLPSAVEGNTTGRRAADGPRSGPPAHESDQWLEDLAWTTAHATRDRRAKPTSASSPWRPGGKRPDWTSAERARGHHLADIHIEYFLHTVLTTHPK
jgi:hypothetical protein